MYSVKNRLLQGLLFVSIAFVPAVGFGASSFEGSGGGTSGQGEVSSSDLSWIYYGRPYSYTPYYNYYPYRPYFYHYNYYPYRPYYYNYGW